MKTWEDYKKEAKNLNPETRKSIEKNESIALLIAEIIDKRNELGYTQRDLAKICGIPQSSIARIESLKVSPTLDTLIRITEPLGLKLSFVNA